jgi:hypothetical protein
MSLAGCGSRRPNGNQETSRSPTDSRRGRMTKRSCSGASPGKAGEAVPHERPGRPRRYSPASEGNTARDLETRSALRRRRSSACRHRRLPDRRSSCRRRTGAGYRRRLPTALICHRPHSQKARSERYPDVVVAALSLIGAAACWIGAFASLALAADDRDRRRAHPGITFRARRAALREAHPKMVGVQLSCCGVVAVLLLTSLVAALA